MSKESIRWQYWADIIAPFIGWKTCNGFTEYLVCDTRTEKGGRLEMVHLYGLTAKDIRKQVAKIIMERT